MNSPLRYLGRSSNEAPLAEMTPQRRSLWPAGICLALLTVVTVNGIHLYYALGRDSSARLIEEQPYERGISFQNEIDGRNRFIDWKWNCAVRIEADTNFQDRSQIIVTLATRSGEPIGDATVSVLARHAASGNNDQTLRLNSPSIPGIYSAPLQAKPGTWLIRVEIRRDGEIGLYDTRIVILPS